MSRRGRLQDRSHLDCPPRASQAPRSFRRKTRTATRRVLDIDMIVRLYSAGDENVFPQA
jgi:hypothetical protein